MEEIKEMLADWEEIVNEVRKSNKDILQDVIDKFEYQIEEVKEEIKN